MTRSLGGALALALAFALGSAAGAQALRSEGLGTAPLPAAPGASARSLALRAALANAVEKAAADVLGAGAPGERAVAGALGANPERFVLSYRKVSEVERARAAGPGREVAVAVEAQVDRGRLADALRRAGLLGAPPPPAGPQAERLVIEPVPSWPSLAALRRRLVELGAREVQIERVEPERVVLTIEGGRDAARLASAVAASPPPGVAVYPDGERDGAPRVRLESISAAPAEALAPIDTAAPKR